MTKTIFAGVTGGMVLSAAIAAYADQKLLDRDDFDRAMGSADTLILDWRESKKVTRSGCASLRDCFDRIRDASENEQITGDIYRHGILTDSITCEYGECFDINTRAQP